VRRFMKGSMAGATAALAALALWPAPASAQAPQGQAAGAAEGRGPGQGRGGRGRGNRPPAGPTPRLPENSLLGVNSGKPDFGGKGMWQVPYIIDMQKQGKSPEGGTVEVPFTAEAKKIFDYRQQTNSKDDPEGFCLPPGVPRMMYTPYPTQIYQLADRILFIYEGGAHVWRIIWMDGRQHPKDPNPSWMGDAIGKWEGDTLVVDTIGFNDKTWLDNDGHPHTEDLHVVERIRRVNQDTLTIDTTIEDPKAYTKPWGGHAVYELKPDWNIGEMVCADNGTYSDMQQKSEGTK